MESRLLAAFACLGLLTSPALAVPIEDRSIVAFTSEPNDLGTAKDFFRIFPKRKCQQDLLDEQHLLYFCPGHGGDVQKFFLALSYDDNTLVLSGVSLHGEHPNLDGTLKELLKILNAGHQ
ncbi:hypothetical protein SAMN05216548_108185 [Faunimonas pinastri]|uniref:Uncharacterized protein n=1 Tax=Faunimonas pinastri TaxID=1855383 RepID=A0A1H9JN87_9HYPH|nr:hypothetical protein [Faunimonas pinastri]SEQ88045.1 hypothetical protein SAMN05216548_108185 [Faunimonas pinastri]